MIKTFFFSIFLFFFFHLPNSFSWKTTGQCPLPKNVVLNKINIFMGSKIQKIQHKAESEGILSVAVTGTQAKVTWDPHC